MNAALSVPENFPGCNYGVLGPRAHHTKRIRAFLGSIPERYFAKVQYCGTFHRGANVWEGGIEHPAAAYSECAMTNSTESAAQKWTAGLVCGVMASGHAITLSPSADFNLDPRPQFPAELKEREGNVLTAERVCPCNYTCVSDGHSAQLGWNALTHLQSELPAFWTRLT